MSRKPERSNHENESEVGGYKMSGKSAALACSINNENRTHLTAATKSRHLNMKRPYQASQNNSNGTVRNAETQTRATLGIAVMKHGKESLSTTEESLSTTASA